MLVASLLHGDLGIFDELALVACVLIAFALLVAFYVSQLRKSKENK